MRRSDSEPSQLTGDLPIERERKAIDDSLLAAMSSAVAEGNVDSAVLLVADAEQDYPDDARLKAAIARCNSFISRAEWLETSLEMISRELEEDHFSAALGHFRQALSLSLGFPALRALVNQLAERQAAKLLPHNWRVAEAILHEAATTQPFFQPDPVLQGKLRRAREDELLSNAIYQTDRAVLEGKPQEARRHLNLLLIAHQNDERIKERLYALDHPDDQVKTGETVSTPPEPKPSVTPAPMAEPQATLSDEETADGLNGFLKPWRAKVLIAQSAWNAVKNFAVLAAATSMLIVAAFLLWRHFSKPAVPRPVPVIAAARTAITTNEPPDEEAWDLVKTTNDASIVRAFLSTYPSSSHALRVKMKLDALEWEKVNKTDEAELARYLEEHPGTQYKAEVQRLIVESKNAQH